MAKCRTCGGSGNVIRRVCGGPSYATPCPECHGTGKDSSERCSTCGGRGNVIQRICGGPSYTMSCPTCNGRGKL